MAKIKIYNIKLPLTAKTANYAKCRIGNKDAFLRIDTGADVTIIPKSIIGDSKPRTVRHVLYRASNIVNRTNLHDCTIEIESDTGWISFRPPGGIMLLDNLSGLLGCDILNQMDMLMVNGIMHIEKGF